MNDRTHYPDEALVEMDRLKARIAELEAVDHRKALLAEGWPSEADINRAWHAFYGMSNRTSHDSVKAALIAALTEERT